MINVSDLVHHSSESLLIIAASHEQNTTHDGQAYALDVYNNHAFKYLRSLLAVGAYYKIPEIVIISPRYGFIRPWTAIRAYNVAWTDDIVDKMYPALQKQWDIITGVCNNKKRCRIQVAGSHFYALARVGFFINCQRSFQELEAPLKAGAYHALEEWISKSYEVQSVEFTP